MGESVALGSGLEQYASPPLPGRCHSQPDTGPLWFGSGHLQQTLCEGRRGSRASITGPSLHHLEAWTRDAGWGERVGVSSRRATAGGPFAPCSVPGGHGSLEDLVSQDPWGPKIGWMPMNSLPELLMVGGTSPGHSPGARPGGAIREDGALRLPAPPSNHTSDSRTWT